MNTEKSVFAWKSLLLLVLILLLSIAINYAYLTEITPQKKLYKNEEAYRQYLGNLSSPTITYAFFGDSHMGYGINPALIDNSHNSFNFGSEADTYIGTYYRLKDIVDNDDVEIKYLVLEFDLHVFSPKLLRYFEENMWFYSQFMTLPKMAVLSDSGFIETYLRSNFPFLGKGLDFFIQKPDTSIVRGWIKNEGDYSTRDKVAETLTAYQRHFDTTKSESQALKDHFVKILKLAKEENITVILLRFPVSEEYYAMASKGYPSDVEFYSEALHLANRTTTNYIVLDYHDAYFDRPYYFSDADHLNHIGATEFSTSISKELKSIKRSNPQQSSNQ